MKKNSVLIMILVLITAAIVFSGGTYAYWQWASANNTNVTFTVAPTFSCSADGGGDITSNDVKLYPTECTKQNAIKRTITTHVSSTGNSPIKMNLWLNIESISTNLANTQYFKYALTRSASSCTSNVIASGNFNGKTAGNTVNLLTNVTHAVGNGTYYLYIWLDKDETNSNTMNQSFRFTLGGTCSES